MVVENPVTITLYGRLTLVKPYSTINIFIPAYGPQLIKILVGLILLESIISGTVVILDAMQGAAPPEEDEEEELELEEDEPEEPGVGVGVGVGVDVGAAVTVIVGEPAISGVTGPGSPASAVLIVRAVAPIAIADVPW